MPKIYSRPRVKVPHVVIKTEKGRKIITILSIIIIAILTAKHILDAIIPIFNTLCENKAKSIATIVSNEQATNVMKEHTYDELFSIEKDNNGNITMVKSNVMAINEIISDVAKKIQQKLDNKGRDNIEIAMRKFYRI